MSYANKVVFSLSRSWLLQLLWKRINFISIQFSLGISKQLEALDMLKSETTAPMVLILVWLKEAETKNKSSTLGGDNQLLCPSLTHNKNESNNL